MTASGVSSAEEFASQRAMAWAPPVLIAPLMLWLGLENYLLFHVGAEFFSSMVGVVLFFVATQTYRFTRNGFLAVLGVVYFWVAMLDGLHALHYRGMGVFEDVGANPATQYWIATRLLEASGILAATFFIGRGVALKRSMAVTTAVAVVLATTIETGLFPDAFIEGEGLTPFKIGAEYAVIALVGLAAWRVHRAGAKLDRGLASGMLVALGVTALAELCFTLYADVYGLLNMVGHLLKILSFWILLDATVRLTLTQPFRQLAEGTAAFDHVSQPAIIFDEEGRVAHANGAFAEKAGASSRALIGMPIRTALADHFGEPVPAPLDDYLATQRTVRQTRLDLPATGRTVEIDLIFHEHPALGFAGSLLLLDRTARVAAERALEAERWRAQKALDNSDQGLWDWNIATGEVTFSDGMMTMTGDPPGSWSPDVAEWEKRLHPDDRETVFAALQDHLDGKTAVYATEHRLRRADGTYLWVLDKGRVVERDAAGRPMRAIGTHADIGARKRLEQELAKALQEAQAANHAKSDFLAAMSHELRTPLNAVIGFSEMIEGETLGPVGTARYRDYAADIRSAGQDLLALIDDVLDLSKIEAGRMELRESEIHMAEKLTNVDKLVRTAAEAKGVKLEFASAEGMPHLWADRRMVKQILLNVLSNAIKFTPSGGKVSVETETAMDGGIVVCVQDTGIGMKPAEIRRALEPFAQVGDTMVSQQGRGTGLGLSLVQRMMDLHGGRLAVESKPNAGTRVHLMFPPDRSMAKVEPLTHPVGPTLADADTVSDRPALSA